MAFDKAFRDFFDKGIINLNLNPKLFVLMSNEKDFAKFRVYMLTKFLS